MEQLTILKERTIESLKIHLISGINRKEKKLIADCGKNPRDIGHSASIQRSKVNCDNCLNGQISKQFEPRKRILWINRISTRLNIIKMTILIKYRLFDIFLKKRIPNSSYGLVNNYNKPEEKPAEKEERKFPLFTIRVYRVVFSYFDGLRKKIITRTMKVTGAIKKNKLLAGNFRFKEYFNNVKIFNIDRIA